MSKSILVIDTPKTCGECEFHFQRLDGSYRCTRNKNPGNIILLDDVPYSWCPLRPLPEKEDLAQYIMRGDAKSFTHMIWYSHGQGWNDCLDKIIGGKNE